jgi:putative nucleotidyltransferase with HDIG domain
MKTMDSVSRLEVPAGSYVVTKRKSQILEAHLGTCVGVGLCDRRANVGGLIHLLLPEPTGMAKAWHPSAYATTGLPLFIRALYDAGASKADLEAYLAGGALVGPISKQDLILNIGGRTSDKVEDILHQEGIPIRMSETGGYHSCRLSLNTINWECQVEPSVIPLLHSSKSEFKKPTMAELDTAVQNVRPIPQIALKIIGMIRDDDYHMKDIGDEVCRDQIISAKVISFCNSALFARHRKIDSINTALVMMGEKRLMQLVLSASLEDFYSDALYGYSLCKGGLYKHALGTALICEKLAEFIGMTKSGIAYTAGLLHDVGKVVLDQYMAPALPLFYHRFQMECVNLATVERDEFGLTHMEAGAKLADYWSLPETLADTIHYHHNPEKATASPELTYLVYLADLLISRFLVGQELDCFTTNDLAPPIEKVGLRPEQFPALVESIPSQIFSDFPLHNAA